MNVRVVFIPQVLYTFLLTFFFSCQTDRKALELLAQEESDDDDIIDEKVLNLTDDEGASWDLSHADYIMNASPTDDIWDQDSVYLEMLAREVRVCAF